MEQKHWNRRELLKSLGLLAAAGPLSAGLPSEKNPENEIAPVIYGKDKKPGKAVTSIVIGAGARGWEAYSSYGLKFPDELQVVGVAEPIPYRRERLAKAFNIPEKQQFVTWEHVFEVPKFADALIITTPDDLHYGPAMAGLDAGYDLLLEKVIAQTWKECNDILQLAEKKEAIVAVCHVLRYSPYFREEMAPAGSTDRCTSGCSIERNCPYSAIRLYQENRGWLQHLKLEEVNDETILRELKNGPYGRCVYRCDNDVVDHQISNFEFEGGITAAFSMEALTHYGGRRTRIFGTEGDISGDEKTLTISNAITGKQELWNAKKALKSGSGHGGGDHGLVHDFVRAVDAKDPALLTSTIQLSMESHLMGFKAEASRLQKGKVEEIEM